MTWTKKTPLPFPDMFGFSRLFSRAHISVPRGPASLLTVSHTCRYNWGLFRSLMGCRVDHIFGIMSRDTSIQHHSYKSCAIYVLPALFRQKCWPTPALAFLLRRLLRPSNHSPRLSLFLPYSLRPVTCQPVSLKMSRSPHHQGAGIQEHDQDLIHTPCHHPHGAKAVLNRDGRDGSLGIGWDHTSLLFLPQRSTVFCSATLRVQLANKRTHRRSRLGSASFFSPPWLLLSPCPYYFAQHSQKVTSDGDLGHTRWKFAIGRPANSRASQVKLERT